MEEKVLVKSEKSNVVLFSLSIIGIGIILFIVGYMALSPTLSMSSISRVILGVLIAIVSVIIIFSVILFFGYRKVELTVTDKRVFGRARFNKRVDLPFDAISAVGTSAIKGIDVSTASGSIKFKFIKNNTEIHSVISRLLLERQEKGLTTTNNQEVSHSNAEEIKKYKGLLDNGVITQEEFDAKKKQLLGL